MTFAGSDFDFDILFTTDSPEVINNTFKGERVTAYDVPKPKKKPNLTEEDLYKSDTFSFGQQIGPLTNISTSIYALLPLFKEGSNEYNKLIERLKQCCVNQSKQIDKTKIGQDVKCIPKIWVQRGSHKKEETLDEYVEVEFNNRILADKKPYFFKYKYKDTAKEIKKYNEERGDKFFTDYRSSVNETIEKYNNDPSSVSQEEYERALKFIAGYPVIDSNCVMNNICHHIEDIDFHIKQRVRTSASFDYKILQSSDVKPDKKTYKRIQELVTNTFKEWEEKTKFHKQTKIEKSMNDAATQYKFERDVECAILKGNLEGIVSNEEQLTNYLVYLFYVDKPGYSKSTLWNLVGRQIYLNIRNKMTNKTFYFPVKDKDGDMQFLYEDYKIKKITLPDKPDFGPDCIFTKQLLDEGLL